MRVLVTFAGGRGHLMPMLPLARALREAGHVLALSGRADSVASCGVFTDLLPHPGSGSSTTSDRGTGMLATPDLEHEYAVVGSWYAGTLAQRTLAITARAAQRWRPDLVVCDEMDFGSIAVAARLGLPCAVVEVIASGALTRHPYVDEGLAALGLTLPVGDLRVSPFPATFRDPAFPPPVGAIAIRPGGPEPGEAHQAISWLREHDGPTAYLSLGTIFNTESGDLFARLLGALGGGPLRVLATVGPEVDPTSIGVASETLRIERFVPQEQVLPNVDVMISHGGSGSVVGALAHGVPLVTVAMGADQGLNAQRLVGLGAGVALDPLTCSEVEVRDAVALVLGDSRVRAAAGHLAAEIAALPPASSAVPRLEALATSAHRR